MLSHLLIHSANIVYLASYAVKDMKMLRWLTVTGCLLLIPYYLVHELWAATAWNVLFLGINVYRAIALPTSKPATHSRAVAKRLRQHEKSSSVSPAPSGMCPEVDRCLI